MKKGLLLLCMSVSVFLCAETVSDPVISSWQLSVPANAVIRKNEVLFQECAAVADRIAQTDEPLATTFFSVVTQNSSQQTFVKKMKALDRRLDHAVMNDQLEAAIADEALAVMEKVLATKKKSKKALALGVGVSAATVLAALALGYLNREKISSGIQNARQRWAQRANIDLVPFTPNDTAFGDSSDEEVNAVMPFGKTWQFYGLLDSTKKIGSLSEFDVALNRIRIYCENGEEWFATRFFKDNFNEFIVRINADQRLKQLVCDTAEQKLKHDVAVGIMRKSESNSQWGDYTCFIKSGSQMYLFEKNLDSGRFQPEDGRDTARGNPTILAYSCGIGLGRRLGVSIDYENLTEPELVRMLYSEKMHEILALLERGLSTEASSRLCKNALGIFSIVLSESSFNEGKISFLERYSSPELFCQIYEKFTDDDIRSAWITFMKAVLCEQPQFIEEVGTYFENKENQEVLTRLGINKTDGLFTFSSYDNRKLILPIVKKLLLG